jgi:hypothetical protein
VRKSPSDHVEEVLRGERTGEVLPKDLEGHACSCKKRSGASASLMAPPTVAHRGAKVCTQLPASSPRTTTEPFHWDLGRLQPELGCGTPSTPPLEELLSTPMLPTPRRPEPKTTEGKIEQVLGGASAIHSRREVAQQQIPQASMLPGSCEPCEGLVATLEIPTAPLSPLIDYTYVPAAGLIIGYVWRYLYTAWFTVDTAWKSKRRIRHQWWHYRHEPSDKWQKYAPWYWLGEYSTAPPRMTQNSWS